MSNLDHKTLVNHPTDLTQNNLHAAGYIVANAAALLAVVTQAFGNLLFQTDIAALFFWDGAAWDPVACGLGAVSSNVVASAVTIPANATSVVYGSVTVNAGKSLTLQAGASLLIF